MREDTPKATKHNFFLIVLFVFIPEMTSKEISSDEAEEFVLVSSEKFSGTQNNIKTRDRQKPDLFFISNFTLHGIQ